MIFYTWLNPWDIKDSDISDINALLSELSKHPKLMDRGRAKEVAGHSFWLVARDEEGRIKGMGTLTVSYIPMGIFGHIDDVVVSGDLRGQHVGENIMKRLISTAEDGGLDGLELTCSPARAEGNNLYPKLGFKKRDTNCYTMKL